MKTIPAQTAARWIRNLIDVQEALIEAERLAGVSNSHWRVFYESRCLAAGLRNELIALAVTEVEIEDQQAELEIL